MIHKFAQSDMANDDRRFPTYVIAGEGIPRRGA